MPKSIDWYLKTSEEKLFHEFCLELYLHYARMSSLPIILHEGNADAIKVLLRFGNTLESLERSFLIKHYLVKYSFNYIEVKSIQVPLRQDAFQDKCV